MLFKKISELFKPNDFTNNYYGWMTNQIGHTAFALFLMYSSVNIFTNIIEDVGFLHNSFLESLNTSIVFTWFWCLFWGVWEVRHYRQTKNRVDFLEDLFFELSGILIFLYPTHSYIVFGVIAIATLKYLDYKKASYILLYIVALNASYSIVKHPSTYTALSVIALTVITVLRWIKKL